MSFVPQIWRDDDEPQDRGVHDLLTLSQFFERYVAPDVLTEAAQRNLDQYRESLAFWEEATGSPTLRSIGERDADGRHRRPFAKTFRKWLDARLNRRDEPLSKNTIVKHCVHVQAVLDLAGPKSRHNEDGASLIADPPGIRKPGRVKEPVDDNFTIKEIGWWLDACYVAEVPRIHARPGDQKTPLVVRPSEWWHSVIEFDYNAGARLGTLLKLRWEWLTQDDLGWWFKVPAWAMKGGGIGRWLHVNTHALAAVERLRGCDPKLVFPWPHNVSWLHEVRREHILARSKIAPERHFGFHGLRKALATEFGRLNEPLAAKLALGHTAGDITLEHYQNRVILAEASTRLPQPVWDRDRDGPQRLLF